MVSFLENGTVQTLNYNNIEKYGWGFYDNSGNYYQGDNSFVKSVTSALARINLGEEGRGMLNSMIGADETITITQGRNVYNGETRTVGFNPLGNASMPTENGFQSSPTFISLAHELAHAEDHLKGTLNQDRTWGGTLTNYAEAEKYSTHRENQFRAEQGQPLRTHYGVMLDNRTNTFLPDPKSRIIDTKGNSLFFKPYNYRKK